MRRSLPAVAIFVATLFPGKSATQIPDKFTNLQVLHDTLSRQTLIRTMKGFTRALGVRCEFCHVGDPARGLSSFDFASDENKHKDIARTMLRMVRNINEEQLTALPFREGIKVECMTCHRGNKEPRFIEDVLDNVQEREGRDSAVAHYRMLRDKHTGGHTYDFSERMLLRFADGMLDRNDTESAIAWTGLNITFYPKSAFSYFPLGTLYAQSDSTALAIANLEQALSLDPNIPPAIQTLSRLKGE